MPSTINASTASGGGIISSADSSGVLELQTAGTTALTVATSGDIGIGTGSPTIRLQVNGASGVTRGVVMQAASDNGAYLLLTDTGSHEWYVGTPNNTSALVFGDSRNLASDGTERMRLNNSGTVILQGGNTSATGTGIAFPATQSSSSDANTLDDYEEGTWTPGITFGGGSTGVTYSATNGGFYTKVGRLVTLTFVLDVTNKGSSTGVAVITGVPFSCINFQGGRGGVAIGYTGGLSVNNPNLMADAGSGGMTFRTPNSTDMTNTAFGTNFNVYATYSYFTS